MSYTAYLRDEDVERLMFTFDTSIKVTRRFQFFLWAQGTLQTFLPHETLVCALGDPGTASVRHEIFSRAMIDPEFEAAVNAGSIVSRLSGIWLGKGGEPMVWRPADAVELVGPRYGNQYMLCHGAVQSRGEQSSFFAFLGVPGQPGERERYIADLLMPHLHMALQRMCANDGPSGPALTAEVHLSERENQVLGWVRDGKTNHEIGQILDISPLTVKNHVQKILRKLNVSNRAQAVARGVAMGLIGGQARSISSSD